MNGSDLFVAAALMIFAVVGMYRGLIHSAVRAVTSVISAGISLLGYPLVCSAVRKTALFDSVKETIIESLGLRQMIMDGTKHGQTALIEGLSLPDAFKERLEVNNNNVIYDLLGVDNIVDYIGGFLANIVVNIVCGILIFAASYIIIHIILSVFGVFGKMPVVKTFNRAGGGIVGLVSATVLIWAVFAAVDAFITQPFFAQVYRSVQQSSIAIFFYDLNLIRVFMMSRMF